MNAQDLRGLAVITVDEAERVGRVEDVLFETDPLRARALRVKTRTGRQLLALADVRSVGPDAITTQDAGTAGSSTASLGRMHLPSLDELGTLNVVDAGGTFVGHIARIDLDPASGTVATVEVRRGDVLGLGGETRTIDRGDIVSVGPELVTVRELADHS